jgi:hypothetical protein
MVFSRKSTFFGFGVFQQNRPEADVHNYQNDEFLMAALGQKWMLIRR